MSHLENTIFRHIQDVLQREKVSFRVSLQELADFTSRMSILLGSGILLHDSLNFLSQTGETDLRLIVDEIAERVENGHSFGESLKEHPNVFNSVYAGLVLVGEQSGALIQIFRDLDQLIQLRLSIKRKLIATLSYPLILFLTSLVLILVCLFGVLPLLSDFFNQVERLPLPTRFLLKLGQLAPTLMVIFSSSCVIIWFAKPKFKQYLIRYPQKRRKLESLPFKTPGFSRFFQKAFTAQALCSISIMLDSGLTINAAMDNLINSSDNLYLSNSIKQAKEKVIAGSSLSEALSHNSLMPKLATQMLAVGEESAQLAAMARHVSELYRNEIEFVLDDIASLLEPIVMSFMGLVVGGVILGTILPMISILQNL